MARLTMPLIALMPSRRTMARDLRPFTTLAQPGLET